MNKDTNLIKENGKNCKLDSNLIKVVTEDKINFRVVKENWILDGLVKTWEVFYGI